MKQFEIVYKDKTTEKETGRSLWLYFRYIYAPNIINMWFWALVIMLLDITSNIEFPLQLISLFMVIYSLVWFPNYRRQMLAALRPHGIFNKESELHFYSNKLEYQCGENQSTVEYSSFTGYFRSRGEIFLLQGKQLFGCSFTESKFGDKLDYFITCLEQAGVKKVRFFDIKRWRSTIILLVLFAVIAGINAWEFFKQSC